MIRQGDVIIMACEKPDSHSPKGGFASLRVVEGEATGHAHVINGARWLTDAVGEIWFTEMFRGEPVQAAYVEVCGDSLLHQEHGTLPLAAGYHKVIRQRQYSPQEIRNVAD